MHSTIPVVHLKPYAVPVRCITSRAGKVRLRQNLTQAILGSGTVIKPLLLKVKGQQLLTVKLRKHVYFYSPIIFFFCPIFTQRGYNSLWSEDCCQKRLLIKIAAQKYVIAVDADFFSPLMAEEQRSIWGYRFDLLGLKCSGQGPLTSSATGSLLPALSHA